MGLSAVFNFGDIASHATELDPTKKNVRVASKFYDPVSFTGASPTLVMRIKIFSIYMYIERFHVTSHVQNRLPFCGTAAIQR